MMVGDVGASPPAPDSSLQVDRIASLEPLPSFGDRSKEAVGVRAAPSSMASSMPSSSMPSLAAALTGEPATTATLLANLPLGRSITARVVDVQADHVVADVGDLRIALAWPDASRLALLPGEDVVLRVLAHRPVLLFQSVGERPEASDEGDEVHWSSDAMRLLAMGTTATAQSSSGAMRFDIPIIEIELDPLPPGPHADDQPPSSRQASDGDGRPGSSTVVERSSAWQAAPATAKETSIALDDVIVGRGTALVNGVEAPPIPHLRDSPPTAPFSPLVLQGPAWDGQPMELVVRRERDDALFDNPVLDHWCGEVTLDLPHLGRVAGHLSFSMQGLRVRIEGDDERSVMTMSAASAELAAAFAHADLRVAGLTVAGRVADATHTGRGPNVDVGYGARDG